MTTVMLATYPELSAGGGVDAYSCIYPGRNLTPAQLGNAVRAASLYDGP